MRQYVMKTHCILRFGCMPSMTSARIDDSMLLAPSSMPGPTNQVIFQLPFLLPERASETRTCMLMGKNKEQVMGLFFAAVGLGQASDEPGPQVCLAFGQDGQALLRARMVRLTSPLSTQDILWTYSQFLVASDLCSFHACIR